MAIHAVFEINVNRRCPVNTIVRQMNPLRDLFRNNRIDTVSNGLRGQFAALEMKIMEVRQCNPSPDPAVYIEFESLWHLTRVTAWESGQCDAEILRTADGNQVAYLHKQVESEGAYLGAVMKAARRMEADTN